jgi:hypothetical protein
MGRWALLTIAALTLMLGTADARVASSSVETGEFPDPNTRVLLIHPTHPARFEVRAAPQDPVVVSWRIHCRSKAQNRVAKHRMTSDGLPIRVRMPVLVRRPRYCNLSADASYKSFDQRGRIAVFIRY